jgi:hypothetical protein
MVCFDGEDNVIDEKRAFSRQYEDKLEAFTV